MKISVFSIVFNIIDTLPKNMFELNIQNMYEYVDEIIIVVGATRAITHYFDGDTSKYTQNGRSTDGTIELLKELENKYEKVKVIIGDGFWDGKTKMCNAASNIASGDYIWQLDSDEFYKPEDIIKIKNILELEKPDAVHFYANHFIGGWDYCIDERCYNTWGNFIPWKRIFKNTKNSYWISHEPPEYVCDGLICNNGKVINRDLTLNLGIKMFHYSFVTYEQILFKTNFYKTKEYLPFWEKFKYDKNTKILDSVVYKFEDEHPDIIKNNYLT